VRKQDGGSSSCKNRKTSDEITQVQSGYPKIFWWFRLDKEFHKSIYDFSLLALYGLVLHKIESKIRKK